MTRFDEVTLDMAWKNISNKNSRYKDMDTKAIGIITITGILLAFINVNQSNFTEGSLGKVPLYLLALTMLSFLITVFLAIIVIRTRIGTQLSTKILIERLKNVEPEHQIGGVLSTIAELEYRLQGVCNNKANELTRAVYALGLSVILLAIYVISTVVPHSFIP